MSNTFLIIYLNEPKLLCFYNISFKSKIESSRADFFIVAAVTTIAEPFLNKLIYLINLVLLAKDSLNILPYPPLLSRDAALVTNIIFAFFTFSASFNFVIELIISAIYPVVSPSPAKSIKVPS